MQYERGWFEHEIQSVIFLLQYDRRSGKLISIESHSADLRAEVSKTRLCLELDLLARGVGHEVVVLEAESEEDLRKTHNRYFRNVSELAHPPRRGAGEYDSA